MKYPDKNSSITVSFVYIKSNVYVRSFRYLVLGVNLNSSVDEQSHHLRVVIVSSYHQGSPFILCIRYKQRHLIMHITHTYARLSLMLLVITV